MKMNGKKLTALLGTAVLAMGILAGCGSSTTETTAAGTAAPATTAETAAEASATAGETKDQAATEAENAQSADLSGAISMVGSTSMEKFANALSESFMEKYPNVTVTAEFVGSGAGIEAVSNGTADIGNSSRNLKDEEKAGGVAENIVAIDGIAVVVDGANTVEDLTKQQLSDIYEGKITNWKDAGGNDAPIVVVGRESGSGTRSAFEELLKLEDMCKYSNELDSTGAVMAKVASTPGAIGYVSLDVLDDTVKAVKLEGAEPTEENIKAGSYFLSRPFVMATKGDISEQNELVKALFDYIYSDEGAEIVKSVGLIAVDK
ncbi:phosphate ABC transporter substrate-binding protein [Enterocloster clostridioformis]|uniref:phosphate ABC transporter substrate-binding protein n=1 Tax=Enterocloster clostridioformis TaxID=1531 RepID=UPI00080C3AFD|nr:phosphate ABC transporter substrate-binding protein [Enterocloster clostridioformis]ANU47508.1 phosphate ABC transporter substrate-binding protein [Lachnoclostridium sp. YL32]NDO30860.1 phosphate ABC transporter substrate-binding protein [Enterocloster clostridioformis]OXE66302.1 phosphate ABC transporter substrate-binding protein [Enterocloster clostridioformis]QQR03594.1 phosphate ABC transporter substrate-binding protein [Enterocloster clostridioformis]